VGLDAAYSACPNWFSGVRVGASYFADERFEFKGVTGALRLQVGEALSPFAGLGMLVGMASHEVDASLFAHRHSPACFAFCSSASRAISPKRFSRSCLAKWSMMNSGIKVSGSHFPSNLSVLP